MDFTIMGLGLNASPEYQAVPKGIASRVDTAWTSGGTSLPIEVVKQLPSGFVVKAELTGPAYQSPLYLTTTASARASDASRQVRFPSACMTAPALVLFGASPQAVTVRSIKDRSLRRSRPGSSRLRNCGTRGDRSTTQILPEFTALVRQVPVPSYDLPSR